MSADPDRYLLARTFYWIAGGGATVTAALAMAVLAGAQTDSKIEAQVATLERHDSVRTQDHDKLIEISGKVEQNRKEIEKLAAAQKADTASIIRAIRDK